MIGRVEAVCLVFSVLVVLFYAGRWAERNVGTFDVVDPVTECRLVSAAEAGPAEVDEAVAFARSAMEVGPWARMDGVGCSRLLGCLAVLSLFFFCRCCCFAV